MPLLRRRGRVLELTPAGRRMVEHADVILSGLAAAEADLAALRAGGRGTVRIAAFPSAARVLLPPLWQRLASAVEHRIDLRISEAEPGRALDHVRRGDADLAVVHAYSLLPRQLPPGCEEHRLLTDPVYFAISRKLAAEHGLVAGQPVDLASSRTPTGCCPARKPPVTSSPSGPAAPLVSCPDPSRWPAISPC